MRFVGLSAAQGQLFGFFDKTASPSQRRAFAQAMADPDYASVERRAGRPGHTHSWSAVG